MTSATPAYSVSGCTLAFTLEFIAATTIVLVLVFAYTYMRATRASHGKHMGGLSFGAGVDIDWASVAKEGANQSAAPF